MQKKKCKKKKKKIIIIIIIIKISHLNLGCYSEALKLRSFILGKYSKIHLSKPSNLLMADQTGIWCWPKSDWWLLHFPCMNLDEAVCLRKKMILYFIVGVFSWRRKSDLLITSMDITRRRIEISIISNVTACAFRSVRNRCFGIISGKRIQHCQKNPSIMLISF